MLQDKIKTLETLLPIVSELKSKHQKIVFTNGCFDIIHAGHVFYLEKAKAEGDILIVGINSDSSVKKLKGYNRPINNESNRCLVLAAFSMIDFVVQFEEDTPLRLIQAILPDVLVKGGDWSIDQIVGADTVIANGGFVKSLPYVEGISSTIILNKLMSI